MASSRGQLTNSEVEHMSEFLMAVNPHRASHDLRSMQPEEACKFLLATKFDVNASIELVRNYEKHYILYDVAKISTESKLIEAAWYDRKIWYTERRDKEGSAIIFFESGLTDVGKDHKSVVQTLFLSLDDAGKSISTQRNGIVILMDLHDASLMSIDHSLMRLIFKIVMEVYPLFVKTVYLIDVPLWFKFKQKLLDYFMNSQAKQKIKMVSRVDLAKVLPAQSIPSTLGGTTGNTTQDLSWLNVIDQPRAPKCRLPPDHDYELPDDFERPSHQADFRKVHPFVDESSRNAPHFSHDTPPFPHDVVGDYEVPVSTTAPCDASEKKRPIMPRGFDLHQSTQRPGRTPVGSSAPNPLGKSQKSNAKPLLVKGNGNGSNSAAVSNQISVWENRGVSEKSKNDLAVPGGGLAVRPVAGLKASDTLKINWVSTSSPPSPPTGDYENVDHLVQPLQPPVAKTLIGDYQNFNPDPPARKPPVPPAKKRPDVSRRPDIVDNLPKTSADKNDLTSKPQRPEPPKKFPHPSRKPDPHKKLADPSKKLSDPPKKLPDPPKKLPDPPKKLPDPPKKLPDPPKKLPDPPAARKPQQLQLYGDDADAYEDMEVLPNPIKKKPTSNYVNVEIPCEPGMTPSVPKIVEPEEEEAEEQIEQNKSLYENWSFLNSNEGDKNMRVSELEAYVESRKMQGLKAEYFKIRTKPDLNDMKICKFPCNIAKNRYKDIGCYDRNRVKLNRIKGAEGSDYIHANFVDTYKAPKAFILTQGPVKGTVTDFWRMIWEQNTMVVVMLTRCVEMSRNKCVTYWPEQGSVTHGDITVEILQSEEIQSCRLRSFRLHYMGEEHVINHFQFTTWPDYGVPSSGSQLLLLIQTVKDRQTALLRRSPSIASQHPTHGPPIVVHCSAGVGRTGTFCNIDYCIRQLQDTRKVNVQNCVNLLRAQRAFAVQTEDQYCFSYKCILEYAKNYLHV